MPYGGQTKIEGNMTKGSNSPKNVARAAIAAEIQQIVGGNPASSKIWAAFMVGYVGGTFEESTQEIYVFALRRGLQVLADTIHPSLYADIQRDLGDLNAQLNFYLKDATDPTLAYQCVAWNLLQVIDRLFPNSHPYRKWYALGLAWGQVMRQWRDSDPVDLALLVHAIQGIDAEDREKFALLNKIVEIESDKAVTGEVLESLLAEHYGKLEPKELCHKLIRDWQRALKAIPDTVMAGQSVGRVSRGKPGRKPKRDALARFAITRRNQKPPMIWKAIAKDWNSKNPDDQVDFGIVRSAVKNWKGRQKPNRSKSK
jgi:hypothetical protein